MATQIDWAKLVEEGRAKDIGVPWNDKELKAIYEYGINPDDVRAGILTPEDLKKKDAKKEEGKMDLERMKKADLIKMAEELGVEFDRKSVTKSALLVELKKILKKK